MSSSVEHRPAGNKIGALEQAEQVWRQIGVRRGDRRSMLADLDAEIGAAQDGGGDVDDVLGGDRAATLREWADASDASGRALRLPLILPAALAGVLVAFGTVLLLLIWATVTRNVELPMPILLTLYGTSAVIALVLADVAVWLVLRRGGDPRATRTARYLTATLPIGALVALGAGVGVARLFHFRHPEISFPLCVVAVLAVMSGAVATGRYWATRRRAGQAEYASTQTPV